jgi:hypothetical protein
MRSRNRELRAAVQQMSWDRLTILETLANAAHARRCNGFVVLVQLTED